MGDTVGEALGDGEVGDGVAPTFVGEALGEAAGEALGDALVVALGDPVGEVLGDGVSPTFDGAALGAALGDVLGDALGETLGDAPPLTCTSSTGSKLNPWSAYSATPLPKKGQRRSTSVLPSASSVSTITAARTEPPSAHAPTGASVAS